MKVLLLYGDGTQAIPVVKELRKAGCVVDAVGESPYGYGSNSRYLNKFYLFENVEDVDKYYLYLLQNGSFVPMDNAD